jgi:hypothetical protein
LASCPRTSPTLGKSCEAAQIAIARAELRTVIQTGAIKPKPLFAKHGEDTEVLGFSRSELRSKDDVLMRLCDVCQFGRAVWALRYINF